MQITPTEAWTKRPDEPDRAYQGFLEYLKMRPRSLQKLADKMDISVHTARNWSSQYDWAIRSEEYDAYNTRLLLASEQKQFIDMQALVLTDEIADYARLVDLWRVSLANLLNASTVSPEDIVRIAKARNEIAAMGRRTARLPMTFNPKTADIEKSEKDGPPVLVWDS